MSGAAHGAEAVGPVETAVHRLAPQCKVAALLAFVVAVALVPYGARVAVRGRRRAARRRGGRFAHAALAARAPAGRRDPLRGLRARAALRRAGPAGRRARRRRRARRAVGGGRHRRQGDARGARHRRARRHDAGARDRRRPRAPARAAPAHRHRRLRAALPAARARRARPPAQRAHRPRRRPALAVAGAHRGALRRRAGRALPAARRARARGDARPRLRRAHAGHVGLEAPARPLRVGRARSRCPPSRWRRRSPCGGAA